MLLTSVNNKPPTSIIHQFPHPDNSALTPHKLRIPCLQTYTKSYKHTTTSILKNQLRL